MAGIITNFTIVEAFIGAVLVKKGLVDKNDSVMRAFVIGASFSKHIIFGRLSCHVRVFNKSKEFEFKKPELKELKIPLLIFIFFILAGSTGAVTALGNTLFPENSLIEGIKKDFSGTAHFLIQLRIFHQYPLL